MYVHLNSEPGLWTVGHYDPSGEWHPESDHNEEGKATARVVELNGGADVAALTARLDALAGRVQALEDWRRQLVESLNELDPRQRFA